MIYIIVCYPKFNANKDCPQSLQDTLTIYDVFKITLKQIL
jgi:hypothetical protein